MKKSINAHVIDLRKKDRSHSPEASPRKTSREDAKSALSQVDSSKKGLLHEWSAAEFTKREKDIYWYITFGIISTALAIFFLLTKNYFGSLITVLFAALVYIYSKKDPRVVRFAITPLGVTVGEKVHLFEELKSFWIFYEPGEIKEVSFRTTRLTSPYLGLPLGKADPVEIRKILLRFLPEKKQEEPVANILARRLGF